ncbi:methyltransferase [Streptomyces millisiae]|uniref:Methyltransferase n=1 Tax=Streptomyces millisiae TaxID=3075542 RepID=A0ABU2LWQ9_9ACTN|nr:methyltransferase [Streptomyces sp. DSM 44918]MDT0322022.1 methyltransferase [Streptomyces sp. DSM 44918]
METRADSSREAGGALAPEPPAGGGAAGEEFGVPKVLALAAGGTIARALAVAARLGIADRLAAGPLPAGELAKRTESHPEALDMLLGTLVLAGVLGREADGAYRLTEDSEVLRSDHPDSLRNTVMLIAETYDDAFRALSTTVRTGESAFPEVFGRPLYEHLAASPEEERVFDASMAELCRPVADQLASLYDFSGVRTVVDVGGGDGTMLGRVLDAHPTLRGVCVDRPSVCERARRGPHPAGDRISFEPADIFTEIPAGADRYLIKNVLHDWPMERQVRALTVIRRAMAGNAAARLLVVEPMLEAELAAPHVLAQMVICESGTRGIAEADMRRLLAAAGFTPLSVLPLTGGHQLFECAPAQAAESATG